MICDLHADPDPGGLPKCGSGSVTSDVGTVFRSVAEPEPVEKKLFAIWRNTWLELKQEPEPK